MIFFTSDLHFGHSSIIRHCSRPFSNVAEMDAKILESINAVVSSRDTLWILGDFAFRGRDPKHYREQITCGSVRLLIGNHDKRAKCLTAGFASVGDVAEVSVGKQRIWLSHYAHRSWPASHRGSWHLYGHSHGSLDQSDRSLEVSAMDVGVDNFNPSGPPQWHPWSMDDLATVLPRKRRQRPYWVDPPQGWLYGFPKMYDPAADGNMTEWMIRSGYPSHLAGLGLPCTFTATDSPGE